MTENCTNTIEFGLSHSFRMFNSRIFVLFLPHFSQKVRVFVSFAGDHVLVRVGRVIGGRGHVELFAVKRVQANLSGDNPEVDIVKSENTRLSLEDIKLKDRFLLPYLNI